MTVSATERLERLYARTDGTVQTNDELARELLAQQAPWTMDDLERVRQAALALVRTHQPIDRGGLPPLAGVDGAAYWSLLGALDRSDERGS